MPASLIWFRRVCWLGVVIWVSTVFMLSSLTGPQIEELNTFNINDKICHFTAFFCGALPLVPALRLTWRWPWKRVILASIIALSTYGALDEVHQVWTPSRSALDPFDWMADTIGALVASPLAAFIHAYAERKYRPTPPGN